MELCVSWHQMGCPTPTAQRGVDSVDSVATGSGGDATKAVWRPAVVATRRQWEHSRGPWSAHRRSGLLGDSVVGA